MENKKIKKIFLTWLSFSSRSHLLSQAFDAKLYLLNYLRRKTLIHILIRYFLASFHTFYILYRTRPEVVFSMNLPVFLPIIVYLFSRIIPCHYIIDSHSGLFHQRVWRKFIPIMKKVYGKCLLNIAHNEYDADIYRSWGVNTVVLGTEAYSYDCYKKMHLETNNNIVVIGSYADDEPTEKIILAAADISDMHFYITGPLERAKKKVDVKNLPRNVVLTGFLSKDKFLGLVKAADVALVLVTTDKTMQMAAWEALSCGTPLILSDWPLLRSTFTKGAIFVENTKQEIHDGIMNFYRSKEVLSQEILQLKEEKQALWNKEVSKVLDILSVAPMI